MFLDVGYWGTQQVRSSGWHSHCPSHFRVGHLQETTEKAWRVHSNLRLTLWPGLHMVLSAFCFSHQRHTKSLGL